MMPAPADLAGLTPLAIIVWGLAVAFGALIAGGVQVARLVMEMRARAATTESCHMDALLVNNLRTAVDRQPLHASDNVRAIERMTDALTRHTEMLIKVMADSEYRRGR